MSLHVNPLVACPALQGMLDQYYQVNPSEPTPLTTFLNSDINLQGIRFVPSNVAPGNGKVRKVTLVYTPRITESNLSTTLTTDCTGGAAPMQTSHDYEIDTETGVQYAETFNIRDLAVACQDNQGYIASRVAAMMDACRRTMETELTTALALPNQMGLFAKTDDVGTLVSSDRKIKSVKTTYTDGRFNEDALSQIYYSTRQAVFNGAPFIFGTGTIEKYFQALKAPANTYWGLNLGEFAGSNYVFMPSYRIGDAFNDGDTEKFIALDTNAYFILQYNKFEGLEGLNDLSASNAGLVQGIIEDPITGVRYNYKFVYSPCGEFCNIFISTAFKLASVPDDMYSSTDRLQGVKGSLTFQISNS